MAQGALRSVASIWSVPKGSRRVLITQAWTPKVTRVLPRGNWQDESGEIVEPHTPAFLPQLPGLQGKRQTRLDLARWLVAPENPLTSRAVVNRLWKQYFGNGLSGLVEDLGAQGEWPSHPEAFGLASCGIPHGRAGTPSRWSD